MRVFLISALVLAGFAIAAGTRSKTWLIGPLDHNGRITCSYGPSGVVLDDEYGDSSVEAGASTVRRSRALSELGDAAAVSGWTAAAVAISFAALARARARPRFRLDLAARYAALGTIAIAIVMVIFEWRGLTEDDRARPDFHFPDWDPTIVRVDAGWAPFVALGGLLAASVALWLIAPMLRPLPSELRRPCHTADVSSPWSQP